jgi:CRP-like cAMP-binding protein
MPQDPHPPPHFPRQDLAAVLQRAPALSRFTASQLASLARRARRIALAAGETLFRQGEQSTSCYVLVSGQLKLYRSSPQGDEVIIDLPEPNAIFAESRAFLENPRYHVSCTALGDCELVAIDLAGFLAALRESPETCLLLLRQLSERAERRVEDIDRLALQSSTCRVAGYLLGLLPTGRDDYMLKVTKGVMASRLAIWAETLSRILKQLSDEGIVSFSGRNQVRVHSRERLRRLSAEPGGHTPQRASPAAKRA